MIQLQIQYLHIAFETWAAIFCIIASICVFATRSFDPEAAFSLVGMLAADAVLNIAEIFAYSFRGNESDAGYIIVRVANFTVFLCGYIIAAFAAVHVAKVIITRGGHEYRGCTLAAFTASGVGIIVLILSRIFNFIYDFNEHNEYYRLPTYPIVVCIALLALLPILIQTILNRKAFRKREFCAFLCFCLFPLAGFLIQLNTYGISLYNLANSVSLIIIVLVHELEFSADTIKHERMRANEQIRLYTRQIQPHFIYNCLSVIRSDLPEGSDAWESLNHFAGFLRGSIDLLTAEGCISAKREFATVNNYLYMEKERFGDALVIERDLLDQEFELPPFTVQTLVENAIRHGIRENPGGRGTLVIKSFMTKKAHVIEVIDDGPGFDIEAWIVNDPEHEEVHVGLDNLRKRLELMCRGGIYITSEPGKGTTARVEIPVHQIS